MYVAVYLEQDPGKVGENALGAGVGTVAQVVEHVGHAAAEGQHDDEESDEEHGHVLHHHVDAEDDGAKVFGGDSDLQEKVIIAIPIIYLIHVCNCSDTKTLHTT